MDYEKICFVSMPYGKRAVFSTRPKIDFDFVYDEVFKPGIEGSRLPEGGKLAARRADKEYSTDLLSETMYRYLEYSRFVLADITGHNPNVLMELGVRFRARPHGTAVFSQPEIEIPHNLRLIRRFLYRFRPKKHIEASRELISKVLTESLAAAKLDSPVYQTLRTWESRPPWFHEKMVAYYNALRSGNGDAAEKALRDALTREPDDGMLRFRLGLLYQDAGKWDLAIGEMARVLDVLPTYGEAQREKGLTELWRFQAAGRPPGMPTGEESLRAAAKIDPRDYRALVGLGEVLSESGRIEESLQVCSRAISLAPHDRDLMLKSVALRSALAGKLVTRPFGKLLRKQATILEKQMKSESDKTSSILDLAQIRLYQGKKDEFVTLLSQGVRRADDKEKINERLSSLRILANADVDVGGLSDGLRMLGKSSAAKSLRTGSGISLGGGGFRGGRGGGKISGF